MVEADGESEELEDEEEEEEEPEDEVDDDDEEEEEEEEDSDENDREVFIATFFAASFELLIIALFSVVISPSYITKPYDPYVMTGLIMKMLCVLYACNNDVKII